MPQQSNWQFCKKCEGLFFAGNNLGVCPAGGTHDDSASGGYVLSDDLVSGGQSDWLLCSQCQGLFFAGNNLGVCPTHSDTGSRDYALPQLAGSGQPGWKFCSKCQGLFFAENNLGICPAGGTHADSGPSRTVIPIHRGQRSCDCGQFPKIV
jgi:hypothetical protein